MTICSGSPAPRPKPRKSNSAWPSSCATNSSSGSSYAGDHVELSDGGDDFASSYGVGAVLSTKFTYPQASPDDENALTPEKEELWRKWVDLYKKNMLSTGEHRGELYGIGFDKPEAQVVAKGATLRYALYAAQWDGKVELRGPRCAAASPRPAG